MSRSSPSPLASKQTHGTNYAKRPPKHAPVKNPGRNGCAYLAGFRGAGRLGKWEGPASTLPPISTTPLVLAWLDDHILPLTCACITVKKDLPV